MALDPFPHSFNWPSLAVLNFLPALPEGFDGIDVIAIVLDCLAVGVQDLQQRLAAMQGQKRDQRHKSGLCVPALLKAGDSNAIRA
jgi:hypothetical protein